MFDLPPATMEFDCGVVVKNVGHIGMAAKAHAKECDSAACIADLESSGYLA